MLLWQMQDVLSTVKDLNDSNTERELETCKLICRAQIPDV